MELQVRADRAHNDILNALVDWGLAGAGLIASAWVLLFLGVRKSWRYVRTANRDLGGSAGGSKSAFLLGASLGLVAILCHSLVDFNMYIPANALLAVALMAMLSSHLRFASDRYWVSSRLWVKALASTALAAGLSCLAWQAWRHTAENFWLARAAAAQSVSTAQAGLLEKAFAAEPRNPLTACAIGEIYRRQSSEGDDGYQQLATRAMEWFARARKLNPWDSICNLGYGWCLDWLDRSDEAGPFFDRADQLDPNSYFAAAWIGIHYLKRGEYAAARSWMERSRELEGYAIKSGGLLDCGFYLDLINRHLMEAATNGAPAGPPAAKGAPK
jgi:tetratricopeptide (TPR) repeat protein